MHIGECINNIFERIAKDGSQHHAERRVLDDIERHAHRKIGTALEMVDRDLVRLRKYQHMYPSVAGSDHDFAPKSRMLERVLGNPRRDKVGAQVRPLADLLYQMFDLIERRALGCRESGPRGAIRAAAKVALRESEDRAFFLRDPAVPPLAPEFFEIILRARAVEKCDMFCKSSGKHRAGKIAFGDHRKTIGKRVAQLLTHEHACFLAMNRRHLGALLKNLPQEVLILRIRRALGVWLHTEIIPYHKRGGQLASDHTIWDYGVMVGDGKKLLILFGSRATGHARADSDWDVAVVADHQFSLGELSEASAEAAGILGANEDKIDIVDMWSASPLLQHFVAKEGKLLLGESFAFIRFKVFAWKRYMGTAKLRRLRSESLKRYVQRIH